MNTKKVISTMCALMGASRLFAGTIDFENAPLGVDLGSYYQGVTFGQHAQVSSQLINLTVPPDSFPAHSGVNVLGNSDAIATSISWTFNNLQSAFSFWYVNDNGMTVTLMDQNYNILSTLLLAPNGGVGHSSGIPANAQFSVTEGSDVVKEVIVKDNGGVGTFFTIDDLSAPGVSGLPAPDAASTLGLLGLAATGLLAFRRKFACN